MHYEPLGKMILIIKLGALGDVLRTTTLLPALKKKFPKSAVVWVTKEGAMPLLQGKAIYKRLPWSVDTVSWAENVYWDVVVSLDKEEGPTALARSVNAAQKYGFGRNRKGLLTPLSRSSEYLFRLGVDDSLKFTGNEKTYPRLIAEACEVEWGPNPYVLELSREEKAWVAEFAEPWGERPLIGLNLGSGDGFAGKRWPIEYFIELARLAHESGLTPIFLGGRQEEEIYASLRARKDIPGFFPGYDFSLRRFFAIVSRLKAMISGDSLAMHAAIAQGVHTIALFGSTTEREIEFYGNGEAVVGKVPCGPCYRRVCPTREECMMAVTVGQVFSRLKEAVG